MVSFYSQIEWDENAKTYKKSENERELGNTLIMKKIHPPTSEIGKELN